MRGRRCPGATLLLLLWSSQSGLAAEMPRLLADFNTQSASQDSVTEASGFVEAGGLLLFSTTGSQWTEDEGMLWSTDGTAEGTRVVSSSICPSPCHSIRPLTTWRGAAILTVVTSTPSGYPSQTRLWRTDGSAAGTRPLTGALVPWEQAASPDLPFF